MRILISGGCGFIGHHIVEHLLKNTDWDIVIWDRYDVSGNINRLTETDTWVKYKNRVRILFADLKAAPNPWLIRNGQG